MLRLRKCLKERALEAVKCELLHPSNVADVLSTLKMLYGRPDAIVQSMVKKIRHLSPPNTEKLETLVNFALAVKNMVTTIRACEVDDFILNASLRYELVERLPSTLKLDWARYARSYADPNLADFSAWLYSIAEDASAVIATSGQEKRSRSTKKDGFLNFHSEPESSGDRMRVPSSKPMPAATKDAALDKCVVCTGNCSTVVKCQRFAELSYDSKWATIKECKLCRKCLRKHNGSRRQQKKCETNGCTFLHHPLLHKQESSNSTTTTPSQEPIELESSCNIHQGQSACYFESFQSYCTDRKR